MSGFLNVQCFDYNKYLYALDTCTDDVTRCASPTEADVERCNDFGDSLCSSIGIVEEENGRRCFKVVVGKESGNWVFFRGFMINKVF